MPTDGTATQRRPKYTIDAREVPTSQPSAAIAPYQRSESVRFGQAASTMHTPVVHQSRTPMTASQVIGRSLR